MDQYDIIVDVESPKSFDCKKCGFTNFQHKSTKIGRIVFHILRLGQIKDNLTMSANINNTGHAETIIQMMKYFGMECVERETVKLEKLPHPVKVYTMEKVSYLKELRKDIEQQ